MGAKMIAPMIAFASSDITFSSVKKNPEPVTLRGWSVSANQWGLRVVFPRPFGRFVVPYELLRHKPGVCYSGPYLCDGVGNYTDSLRMSVDSQFYWLHVVLQCEKEPGACHAPGFDLGQLGHCVLLDATFTTLREKRNVRVAKPVG